MPTSARRSSSQRKATSSASAVISPSSRPFSTKAREVTIVPISAAFTAARMLVAPAVKLIIAGTRPAEWSPRKASTAALALGSITPTAPSSGASRASRRPITRDPANRRR